MPTGCKSVYLDFRSVVGCGCGHVRNGPAGDLKRRAKDLGAHKLRHREPLPLHNRFEESGCSEAVEAKNVQATSESA